MRVILAHLPTPTSLWLLHHPLLCHLMAAVTLIVELLNPVSLFSNRLALFWIPAGISLLVGIDLTMDIWFLPLIVLHVFWIPWNFLLAGRLGLPVAET